VYAAEPDKKKLLDRLKRSKALAKDAWREREAPAHPTQVCDREVMFFSSGSAAGRSTAVRNVVRGRTTFRSPDRQWIELSLHQDAGTGTASAHLSFDTQLSEIVGFPRFYGVDPKIPSTTLGRQRLRTTVIRHFQAWKKR
jgi:hypothetical protein